MKWRVLLILLLGAAAIEISWYPCKLKTTTDQPDGHKDFDAECADVKMPLCHDKICTDEAKEISIFLKRIPATQPGVKPKALWMLNGGPGSSSKSMEDVMLEAFNAAKETVTLYTMDHRGTGRSTILQCSKERPRGQDLMDCLASLGQRFGDNGPIAFSVTSAAMDLKTIVESSTFADTDVFIYGLSYGTYLVERLMHLEPQRVKGYILDSVQSNQLKMGKDAQFNSNWEKGAGEVVRKFLSHCDENKFCKSKIGPDAKKTLKKLYQKLDKSKLKCSSPLQAIAAKYGVKSPSVVVSQILFDWLTEPEKRVFIPALIYRLNACTADDESWINELELPSSLTETNDKAATVEQPSGPFLNGAGSSDVAFGTILFSELWQVPSVTAKKLNKYSLEALMSMESERHIEETIATYCIYVGNNDKVCTGKDKLSFVYPRDKYWGESPKIPDGSSVLMLSGELDPATPIKYAKQELNAMVGAEKLLVSFPSAPHDVLAHSPIASNPSESCALDIILSYVAAGGNVKAVKKDCVAQVEKLNFETWDEELSKELFGSKSPYEKTISQALLNAAAGESKSNFLAATVLLSGVSAVSAVVIVIMAVYIRSTKQHNDPKAETKGDSGKPEGNDDANGDAAIDSVVIISEDGDSGMSNSGSTSSKSRVDSV
ncbi:hypothetical protein LEN26_010431 [Aphanomyces euteiches]|nr:hypothetical protein LEN26_010431 [Aphanomyces euteiches]KAH9126186.1 hypothetical protein AeMF1_003358 [Aphanomyces euteiches]KAH9188093.1 hypothetical protein AeNC1_009931 [Aphanomyces euteiches]